MKRISRLEWPFLTFYKDLIDIQCKLDEMYCLLKIKIEENNNFEQYTQLTLT